MRVLGRPQGVESVLQGVEGGSVPPLLKPNEMSRVAERVQSEGSAHIHPGMRVYPHPVQLQPQEELLHHHQQQLTQQHPRRLRQREPRAVVVVEHEAVGLAVEV